MERSSQIFIAFVEFKIVCLSQEALKSLEQPFDGGLLVLHFKCIVFWMCFMLSLFCIFIVFSLFLQYKSLEQGSDGGVPV